MLEAFFSDTLLWTVSMGDPGTWYPISWIIGFFRTYDIYAVHFEYILHLYIAGIGMYYIGKLIKLNRLTCIIIGVSYMLSGVFISNAQHIGWLIRATWFPYVIFYFNKVNYYATVLNTLKLSAVLFLMLSGGYPGFFISTAYILLCYYIYIQWSFIKQKNID